MSIFARLPVRQAPPLEYTSANPLTLYTLCTVPINCFCINCLYRQFFVVPPPLKLTKFTLAGDNGSDWVGIFANFRWRMDVNRSSTRYDISCTEQESSTFTRPSIAGSVSAFPGIARQLQVECVRINRKSQTFPLVLYLVVNIERATNYLQSDMKEQKEYLRVVVPKRIVRASTIKNMKVSWSTLRPPLATSKPKI